MARQPYPLLLGDPQVVGQGVPGAVGAGVVDKEGYARRAYGIDPAATSATLFLVRPDGYVGLALEVAGGPATLAAEAAIVAVDRYLDRISPVAP